jgi:RNA polymerase sigma-70 factor (ECF subfamily)
VRPDVEDAYLVRRARDGYLDAFELLTQRYTPLAYRVAFRLCGDRSDAQDITQEALIAAWENLGQFRSDAAFPTWLYRIVTRKALTKISRRSTIRSLDSYDRNAPDRAAGPARRTEEAMTVDAVAAAVAALPLPQRVAVVLHHFEGLSNAEVAAITHTSEAAVRSHLYRARRTLGKSLAEWR